MAVAIYSVKIFFVLKKFSNLYSTVIRNLFRFATKRIASGFAKSLDPFPSDPLISQTCLYCHHYANISHRKKESILLHLCFIISQWGGGGGGASSIAQVFLCSRKKKGWLDLNGPSKCHFFLPNPQTWVFNSRCSMFNVSCNLALVSLRTISSKHDFTYI